MAEKISGPTLGQSILAEGPIFAGTMIEVMGLAGDTTKVIPLPKALEDLRAIPWVVMAFLPGSILGLTAGVGAMFTEPADWGTHDKDGNWVAPTAKSAQVQVNRFVLGPDADATAPRKFQMEGATRSDGSN